MSLAPYREIVPFQRAGSLMIGDELQIKCPSPGNITHFVVSVIGAPNTFPLVLHLQKESGEAATEYLEAAIPANYETTTYASGSIAVLEGDLIYVRISDAPDPATPASFLSGYFEITKE